MNTAWSRLALLHYCSCSLSVAHVLSKMRLSSICNIDAIEALAVQLWSFFVQHKLTPSKCDDSENGAPPILFDTRHLSIGDLKAKYHKPCVVSTYVKLRYKWHSRLQQKAAFYSVLKFHPGNIFPFLSFTSSLRHIALLHSCFSKRGENKHVDKI